MKELGSLRLRVDKVNCGSDAHLMVMKEGLLCELDSLTCTSTARLHATSNASEDNRPIDVDTDHHFHSPIDDANEIVQVSMFLVVFCCVVARVSQCIGDFLLGLIAIILNLTSHTNDTVETAVPTSVQTVLDSFNLEGQTTRYAVCTACHCTYKPQQNDGASLYPSHCNNQPQPGLGICGQKLLEHSSKGTLKPIRVFVYHHFHDYLARLLARSDIERIMDMRCDELKDSLMTMDIDSGDTAHSHPLRGYVQDIFEAELMATFRGPLGMEVFVDRPGTEGRYAFALNLDFFPPEGMRVRGAKVSVGLLSMACLNLPLDM